MSLPHTSHPKYRRDIDGLRAIAVLSVVAYHAFPQWMKGGFIGVDVFFVISGYLISTLIFQNLDKGTFSFTDFYARRIRRIFPALIVVLASCLACGWFVLLPDEYKELGKHIAGGAGSVSNFILWKESGYFDDAADAKPLLHLWSLGVEEQFYLIWPLLLWVAYKKRFNLVSVGVLVAIVSFYLNLKQVKADVVADFYSPQTRFWELMCGSILAWVTLYKTSPSAPHAGKWGKWLGEEISDGQSALASAISVFALLALICGLSTFDPDLGYPGMWALLPVLSAVLLIFSGPNAWVNRTILSNRVAVWFGLISFPLYLWHWPLLSFSRIVETEEPSLPIRVTAVVLSIALAWLTYRFLEIPVRTGPHSRGKVAALVILITAISCAGYGAFEWNGFGFRFPQVVQDLDDFKYDFEREYRQGICFLQPRQTFKEFDRCGTKAPGKKKTIVLWGDSHAAHLYRGLEERYGATSNIVQYTAAACPPIADIDITGRGNCRGLNNFVMSKIAKEPDDIVVMSAVWTTYDLSNLEKTIATLKKMGVKKIFVVGPVPEWTAHLPKLLARYYIKSTPHTVPSRLATGLDQKFMELDGPLGERVKAAGAAYISVKDILCDQNGCITKIGKTSDSLIAWDSGHLTNLGSAYLIGKFPAF